MSQVQILPSQPGEKTALWRGFLFSQKSQRIDACFFTSPPNENRTALAVLRCLFLKAVLRSEKKQRFLSVFYRFLGFSGLIFSCFVFKIGSAFSYPSFSDRLTLTSIFFSSSVANSSASSSHCCLNSFAALLP